MMKPAQFQTIRQGDEEIHDDIAAKSDVSQEGSLHGKLKTKEMKVQTMNPYSVLPYYNYIK